MAQKRKSASVTGDISSDLFRVAAMFVARQTERAFLEGVRIVPHPKKGVVLVGTDGHRLIVLHDQHGRISAPVTLAYAGLRACPKPVSDRENRWRIRSGVGPLCKGESRVAVIAEGYPQWEEVIKWIAAPSAKTTCAPRMFNPKYMASFARAAALLQSDFSTQQMVVVPGKTPSDPIVILFPYAPHAFGLLMPMRCTVDGTLPGFIAPMLKKHAAKKAA